MSVYDTVHRKQICLKEQTYTAHSFSMHVFHKENKVLFGNTLIALSGPKHVWLVYLPSSPILAGLLSLCLASWKQAPTLRQSSAKLVSEAILYLYKTVLFVCVCCYFVLL